MYRLVQPSRSSRALFRARTRIATTLLALAITGAQAVTPSRVLFQDCIRPVAATPVIGPVNPRAAFISRAALKASESSAPMSFEVVLKLRNFAELRTRLSQGERISREEMAAKYEPLAADYQATLDWLTGEGLTVTHRDSHHMAIFVRGTVGQIAQAMQVNFARVTSDGVEYTSAVTAPSVPASLSAQLVGINGLQPHLRAHKHLVRPEASSGTISYTPAQIAQAYQASGLYSGNITGAGQTIAIVIDAFPSTGDLLQFWQTNGVSQSLNNIQFVQVVAGNLPVPGGEETLDTEWSSAIAPGAKVRVYATLDLGNAHLDAGYQQVLDDVTAHPEYNIHQMSMSYGIGETLTTHTQMQADHQFFLELTAAGVTCFASTGDNGSTPGLDSNGNEDETGVLQPESPASDPDVIAVGGTTLQLNAGNNVTSEVVWNNSIGAGGGGISTYFAEPAWQSQAGIASGGYRTVPDLSCSSDPNFGAATVYDGVASPSGGTSWASPTCAAFCALLNQARANGGLAPVGQFGPLIYPLIGTNCFRDITSGTNATATSNTYYGGVYQAGGGYDEATGIGAPLMLNLTEALVSPTLLGVRVISPVQSILPGNSATYTVAASGSPTYQWQRRPAGSTTWNSLGDNVTYSGSASNALTVTNATTAMNGDQFQCVVTYSGTSVVTSAPTCVLSVEIPWIVSTLAGNGSTTGGFVNNTGTSAQFDYPTGIAVDSAGNVYVADLANNVIRRVTSGGVVTTPYGSLAGTAGSTNGTGNGALFSAPRDIAVDGSNNLYVADEGNNLVRKITTSTGVVTTLGASAGFKNLRGLAVDTLGNVYVADSDNNTIREIATSGVVTTIAGQTGVAGYADGAGTTQALFNGPIGIAVDSARNVYVADYGNGAIRKITTGGVVSTIAGQGGAGGYLDGPGSSALFDLPRGVAVDGAGNLFVTDSFAPITAPPFEYSGNNVLRKITPAGVVSTLAGGPGIAGLVNATGNAAKFFNPCGVAIDPSGVLYIGDAGNNTIRSVVAESFVTVAATLPFASAIGPAAGQFTFNRSGSTLTSLAVNYAVAGTAVSNTDYTALPVSITIPAGASSATLAVNPLTNAQATANRTVKLTLTTSANGIVLSPTPAIVTLSEAQATSFGNWEAGYSFSGTANATPLGDGTPNLLKYVFNIDPSQPMTGADRASLPIVDTATIGATPSLTLTYREYAAVTGVTLHIQTSPDLQTWTTVTNPTRIQTGIDTTTGDPIMQAQVPLTGATEFIRLNVTSP